MSITSVHVTQLRRGVVAAATVLAMATTHAAAVLSGTVAVTLTSPGGVTTDGGATVNPAPVLLSDTPAVADGIHANDGPGGFFDTNIGGFMLPGEFIVFGGSGDDISLRVAAGSQDDRGTLDPLDDVLASGYLSAGTNRARYVLSGLNLAGEQITGFSISGTGFISPLDLDELIGFDPLQPGTLSIYLDAMRFAPDIRGALFAGGNLLIDLKTCVIGTPGCGNGPPNPTPEPATLALVLAALAGLQASRRRSMGRAGFCQ